MTSRPSLERSRLERAAADFQRRGYVVYLNPSPESFGLPAQFSPDLIAVRGDEKVLVEVKTPATLSDYPALEQLSSLVQERPGWRFELLMASPVLDHPREPESPPHRREMLLSRAEEALRLALDGHAEAGLLLAWSAIEGVLRLREARKASDRPNRPLNIKQLYSLAQLTKPQYDLLDAASRARSRIAHGYASEIDDLVSIVERVVALTRKAANPDYPTVEEIVEWFFEHYEDPAQHVPHDSSEGGYQYYAGGPYDAREVLAEQFADVDDDDLEEAVSQIESEGFEWVRKGDY